MKKILPLLLLLFITSIARGQVVTSFSPDSAVFIKEIDKYMNTAQKDEPKEQVKIFVENWTTGKYNKNQQKNINRLANDMIIKRMKPDREFNTYLTTINIVTADSTINDKFDNWIKILRKSLDKSTPNFKSFLEMSFHLFSENAFYVDNSRMWYTDDKTYDFLYDGEPRLVIGNTTVHARSVKSDLPSITIKNTSGTFDPSTKTWQGNGGIFTWEKVGLDSNQVYAELGSYKVVTSSATFVADSVQFINTEYFEEPILGYIKDQVSPRNREVMTNITLPEFGTYSYDIEIESFGDEAMSYVGGFQMKGARVYGVGDANNKATFTFNYEDRPFIYARSKRFSIDSVKIVSEECALEVDMDSGKLLHPQVWFNYNKKKKRAQFERGDKGITQAPFFNTYHGVEIYVDMVFWVVGNPMIELDMEANEQAAVFESANYYRDFRYEKVQGMLGYNPIDRVFQYTALIRNNQFNIKDYAFHYGSKVENLMNQFIMLADQGYIFFDVETGEVEVREKVNLYRLAHRKLTDYDVIRFNSNIGARSNASINLINNHMKVEGVAAFIFSDSQGVYVTPTEQTIVMRHNRDIAFAGKITAGRFEFYGKDFLFDYDEFKIRYSHIDSMRIYFPDTAGRGLIPVNSVLQDVYGTLYIDKPNNKSGLKEYSEYPIFVSDKGSNVFYDRPSTHGGIYKRNEFFFKVDPFTIDSLDNFTQEGLEFGGTLYSAGILPDITHKVTIQDDYSLGFKLHSPPGGWPLYGGKGNLEAKISLSNLGLYANGEVEYLGSTMHSDEILLLPKEMKVKNADKFDLPESEKYPLVAATNVEVDWKPYGDSMQVSSKEEPIKLYSYGYDLTGSITLMPDEVAADGTLSWPEADLTSASMHLGPKDLDAESSSLKIKTIDKKSISFEATDVKADIDFDKRYGEFKQNKPGQTSTLTQTKYVTNMPEFNWDMDEQTMDLKRGASMPKGSTYFMSTHPDQDSLKFAAESALFDIKTNTFYAEGVPYIAVADSKVIPNEGKVTVLEDAAMKRLYNANIVADSVDGYHNLYEVNVTINSRVFMRGNGKYDYVDQLGKKQVIYMDTVYVNYDIHVQADGFIKDSFNFTIGPRIQFKGKVEMISAEKDLYFKGFVLPIHKFEAPRSEWFRHRAQIPKDSVYIFETKPQTDNSGKLHLGFLMNRDSLYPGFYTYYRAAGDHAFMTDTGVMYFNYNQNQFYFGDVDRLMNGALTGNYGILNDGTGIIKSYGKIDMGLADEGFKLTAAGAITKNAKDSLFKAEMALLIDFEWPKKAVDRLVEVIREKGETAPTTNNQREVLQKTLYELIEPKNVEKVKKEFDAYGSINLVDELQKMFFISEVNFYWDVFDGSFVCNGPIGLTSIKDEKIGKQFNAKIRFDKRFGGDRFQFLLEFSKYDYIFIEYNRTIMTVFSSDGDFNNLLMEDSDKVTSGKFRLRLGAATRKVQFVKSFE